MYSQRDIMANLDDIPLSSSDRDVFRKKRRSVAKHIDILKEKGISHGNITCLTPNVLVDHGGASRMWVHCLKQLKEEKSNPPEGVIINGEQWLVPVTLITPCGKCRTPLMRGCRCVMPK